MFAHHVHGHRPSLKNIHFHTKDASRRGLSGVNSRPRWLQESPTGNRSELLAALKECGKKRDLQQGKTLHCAAVDTGLHSDRYIANALINMYSKCGCMLDARAVFDTMIRWDVVSWNVLILGYVENGASQVALDLFTRMSCKPESVTFVAALKACIGLSKQHSKQVCLERGMEIHRKAREYGFEDDIFVANTIMDMYSKCRSTLYARAVFENMTRRDAVTYNILILGYVENGESLRALELFTNMDCEADRITYIAALKACVGLDIDDKVCLENASPIHSKLERHGFDRDIFVSTGLVEVYSKCSYMYHSQHVFDSMIRRDVVSWTSLVHGYVENGQSSVALDLFKEMDCEANTFTYVAAVKACASLAGEDRSLSLVKGMCIHQQAKERGYDTDVFVATNLVEMYSKCGSMHLARAVFDKMTHWNTVTWNVLILGYVENGQSLAALEVFTNMDCIAEPNTFVAILRACGSLGALGAGQRIHADICKLGLEQNKLVSTGLVCFYGKCGEMEAANEVFNALHTLDVVFWTALLAGYSSIGDTKQVFLLLNKMQEAGLELNSITMVFILTACSHTGMVEEGIKYFESMYTYGVCPHVEHYHCMVDMLGRANRLQDALTMVNNSPFKVNTVTWKTLLSACRNSDNMEVSKLACDALTKLT